MTEPVSSATVAAKILSLSVLVGSGIVGAVLIAAFDPPENRRVLFAQAAVAGIGSLICGPVAVRAADYFLPFFDLSAASPLAALELAAPVYLIVGALSWGVFGALAKLRSVIRERGAEEVARRVTG